MAWILCLLGLTVGGAVGWAFTVRAHGRRLRDLCHYEAADIVDPPREA